MMNTLMWITNFDGRIPIPAIIKPQQLWTGKQIFSLILPEKLFYSTNTSTNDINPDDSTVTVYKGELLEGTLNKHTLGTVENSLVHVIWLDCGPDTARDFLNDTQSVINYWLSNHGFSIGIAYVNILFTLTLYFLLISFVKLGIQLLMKHPQKRLRTSSMQ